MRPLPDPRTLPVELWRRDTSVASHQAPGSPTCCPPSLRTTYSSKTFSSVGYFPFVSERQRWTQFIRLRPMMMCGAMRFRWRWTRSTHPFASVYGAREMLIFDTGLGVPRHGMAGLASALYYALSVLDDNGAQGRLRRRTPSRASSH